MSKSTKVTPISDSPETVSLMKLADDGRVSTTLDTVKQLMSLQIFLTGQKDKALAENTDLCAIAYAVNLLLEDVENKLCEIQCVPPQESDS